MAADALSKVILKLDTETMKSMLDGVNMGAVDRADAHDPVVAKADKYTSLSRKLWLWLKLHV